MEENYFLYILRNGRTKEYKIGRTNNLNRRIKQLQTGCPNELRIEKIYTHYDNKHIIDYETTLHKYYKKLGCKIRDNGEWFKLDRNEIAFLCQPDSIEEQENLMEFIREELKKL